MGDIKTKENDGDVQAFLNSVEDAGKRADAFELLQMFEKVTGEPAKMWGPSIVGFGKYHYKSEKSRQEADWMIIGFSPRKAALTLYLEFEDERVRDLLERLGKHKTAKVCLYINKLADVNRGVLEEIIAAAYASLKKTYTEKGWI